MAANTKVSVVTRKSTDIWLVGQISSSLCQTKLPGIGIDQLLAFPNLQSVSGTGQAIASAVNEALESWIITEQVKCTSFDTTIVNTWLSRGACALLEQKMNKEVLWLACRHHIPENMLQEVVVKSLGVSREPDILSFK